MATDQEEEEDIWLLIIAHPDDESMFFIPTLRNILCLDDKQLKPKIQILCLSNGDYRDVSDGPIRTNELYKACSLLGIIEEKEKNCPPAAAAAAVTVLDDKQMKDGPNEVWNSDLIADTIVKHLQKITTAQQQSISSKRRNVNIITFDQVGVSGHPNHVDVFRGIKHFVHERCQVKLNDDEKKWMIRLKLKRPSTNGKVNGDNNYPAEEVDLRVLTLKSISNPLYKYFLWIVVELIPMILIWLISYTIYFLLGGLLFSKNAHGPWHFTRMNTTSDGKQIRCRLFDPALVWLAMAAHQSQFVWYRRLSVLFSRYTYLNDLHEIHIDTSLLTEEGGEEEGDALPPVKTIEEDDDSPKFILSNAQMTALREAVLPIGLHHRPWKRIYSLSRDGDSFVSFERHIANWNAKFGDSSTLLVVKTTKGEVIGGYADAIATSSPRPGTARSCLFREEKDCMFQVYGKQNSAGFFEGSPQRIQSGGTSGSSKKIILDSSRRIIAFGGGIGMKSGEGFGLSLEDGFSRGTTACCEAFSNEPLVEGNGGVFDVLDVEVWGFVFGQF